MLIDRLLALAAFSFINSAIPSGSETGKNCVFVSVGEGKLNLIGGGQFVTKKAVLSQGADGQPNEKPLPETFMIPKADILAFKKMMEENKADCKKLPENDPNYLFIEITDTTLTSYGGKVVFEQPKFEFKDLEFHFQIEKTPVDEIPVMSADLTSAMAGFYKSDKVMFTFSGKDNPILLEQKEHGFSASLAPPIEAEQTTIDDQEA